YNSVISFMNQQLDYKDPSGGKLGGDPLLIGLREELRRLVSDVVTSIPSDSYDRLSEIGITTVDKSGILQLDEAKLREALAKDRAAVQRLLVGDPAAGDNGDGVLSRFQQRVETWLQANTGLLDTRIKSLQDRVENYAEQIERMEYRLQLREQNMLRQFQALESLISTLQAQENWLTQQINQISALWRPRR
ncbi:MAG: flagellar hook protein, partial [Bacillota bacterium]